MYRSFVTCDDPDGVVECGTIRRSKGCLQKMENSIESGRAQKKFNKSSAIKKEKEKVSFKGTVEEYRSPSSFQLLEVSREAWKLNQMTDSWSKGQSHQGQSKDIAKDLLKGALDLQESLIMLGKLQEASQYVAQLKKKQKERSERRIDDLRRESRSHSCQFGDQSYGVGFQKPRLSADGSSTDCIEELREAIRDSLDRQNLISIKNIQERTSFDRLKMDSLSNMPSTSSSKSSMFPSNFSHSTDSSVSQTVPQKTEKGPNLIARLMGLEGIPIKACQQVPQKQMDTEKNVSSRRSLDVEVMPKIRKPEPVIRRMDAEESALKEIIETMHFKGLLKSNSVKEFSSWSHQFSSSHSKQKLMDDIPPIVLIKPMRGTSPESEEALALKAWEEGGISTHLLPVNKKVKQQLAPRLMDYKERTLNASRIHSKAEGEAQIKRLSHKEGYKDHGEVVAKHEKKEVKKVDQQQGAMNENQKNRKLAAQETPMKQPVSEEGAKNDKIVVKDEKEVKTRSKGSSKLKASSHVTRKQQKKETSDSKSDKNQKVVTSAGKLIERDIVKPKIVPRSQDQANVSSTKPRNSESGLTTKKNQIQKLCSPTPKSVSRHMKLTAIHNSKDQKKKEKTFHEPAEAKLTAENVECKEDDKMIPKENVTKLAHEPSVEQGDNHSELQVKEHCNDYVCDATSLTSENKMDAKPSEEADDLSDQIDMNGMSIKTRTKLKAFLMNCSFFLTHADELFHLNTACPRILPTSDIYDSGPTDMKLILDYANEFIDRRSLPDSEARHPMLPIYAGNSRIWVSLHQLIDEVCTGVETLRNYGKLAGGNLHTDSVYAILERDVKCNGVVSGTWDLGWRNGFSAFEAEQTVNHIEKLLVSDLIQEVFT